MIIAITTIAALTAAVFGIFQTRKLNAVKRELLTAKDDIIGKDATNKILRGHMTNIESELKGANDYIKTLRSELQSCTDKAKAAAAKTQSKANSTKVEKAAPAMTSSKTKRPYKKKGA